jgi:hypothetical protein
LRYSAVLAAIILLVACGDAAERVPGSSTTTTAVGRIGDADEGSRPAPGEPTSTTIGEQAETPGDRAEPEPAPTTEAGPKAAVPAQLIAEIVADLAERIGANENELAVVRADSVVWNDGALGCPAPGESYLQALVDGYWVVLEHEGTEYDYRASHTGFFKLCEGGGKPPYDRGS